MWIRKPNDNLMECSSWDCHSNLLWKEDEKPIYIMDNHLSALWCWMQECDPDGKYNFMHIDRHQMSRFQ